MEWQGQVLEEGPYKASCDGYNLDIDIISKEPIERKKKLLEAAINAVSYTHLTLPTRS